jgi:branched-chain amino acid transport system substrate-binding protein
METAGGDKAKIKTELEKTKNFAGVDGVFTYSSKNHDGMDTKDLVIIKIEDGKWVLGAE